MGDVAYASNKGLYITLMLIVGPVAVATIVGLVVGLIQTVTQLQEQTLSFGVKVLAVSLCLFLLAGWYGEVMLAFSREMIGLALG
ncbi:EscS/YscS/HrcS family type III secretion system export apparatus protein [Burkholderia dolosa]|uniref:EscS/YscS/HrcS family type III secretion system export apparatus protein n=2 Tax=Burkholderia dolosa TaxID=152500 RepID=A0A892IH82_9BURK|nr:MULTISPECIES: EscS/YscS/HrcS family type III secretion system export apparatus protein [Burkholderia]AKE06904.1 type III secretion system protein SpaQ [Burkholderia cepacia]AJY09638.1 type III secretion, HrpO family protein [Burkholderia dolosa AU0158]AYZ95386.1 EscS/YscS/HrcS family type III secretion system export apparatus protein [Burkholderia dolosa]EAY71546.1 Type III secretory pathway component EscS [Burkholderia dolosa AU0158]ETP63599.1 type III secretion system protein SpaQ [Burkho